MGMICSSGCIVEMVGSVDYNGLRFLANFYTNIFMHDVVVYMVSLRQQLQDTGRKMVAPQHYFCYNKDGATNNRHALHLIHKVTFVQALFIIDSLIMFSS